MQLRLQKQSTDKGKLLTTRTKIVRIIGGTKENTQEQLQTVADMLVDYDVVSWDGDAPNPAKGCFADAIEYAPSDGSPPAKDIEGKLQPHQLPEGPSPWGVSEDLIHGVEVPTINEQQYDHTIHQLDVVLGDDWRGCFGEKTFPYLGLAIVDLSDAEPEKVIWLYDNARGQDPEMWRNWVSLGEFVAVHRHGPAPPYVLIGRNGEVVEAKDEPWYRLIHEKGWC